MAHPDTSTIAYTVSLHVCHLTEKRAYSFLFQHVPFLALLFSDELNDESQCFGLAIFTDSKQIVYHPMTYEYPCQVWRCTI